MRIWSYVAVLLATAFLCSPALAIPVLYEFSGVVTTSWPIGEEAFGIHVGDSFTGQMLYNPDATNCSRPIETVNVCGGGLQWGAQLGPLTLLSNAPSMAVYSGGGIFVSGRTDVYPFAFNGFQLLPQVLDDGLWFTGYDEATTDHAPPTLDFDTIGSMMVGGFFYVRDLHYPWDGVGEGKLYGYQLEGMVTQIHQVPEPATLGLLGLGLLGAATTRRRQFIRT